MPCWLNAARYFQFISPVNTHAEIHVVVILLAWNSKNMPFLSSLFHWQLVSFQLFPPRLLFCRKRSRTIRIHSLLKFVQQLALFTANSSERAVSIARYLLNQHCSVLSIVAFLLWLSAHLLSRIYVNCMRNTVLRDSSILDVSTDTHRPSLEGRAIDLKLSIYKHTERSYT